MTRRKKRNPSELERTARQEAVNKIFAEQLSIAVEIIEKNKNKVDALVDGVIERLLIKKKL